MRPLNSLAQKLTINEIAHWILVFLLVGGATADAANSFLHSIESPFWRISIFLRGFVFLLVVLVWCTKWPKKWHNLYLVFCGVCLGAISLFYHYAFRVLPELQMEDYSETASSIVKYLFIFALYALLIETQGNFSRIRKLAATQDWVLLSYIVAIFVGFALNVEWMRSYPGSARVGFKGIIPAQNETTGVLVVAVAWFFMRWQMRQRGFLWPLLAIVGAFTVGTKGLWLGAPLVVFGLALVTWRWSKALPFLFAGAGVSMVGAGVLYGFSEGFREALQGTWDFWLYHYYFTDYKANAFIGILFSGRDVTVSNLLETLFQQMPWALLVGGVPISYMTSEIDLLDGIAVFGLPIFLINTVVFWNLMTGGRLAAPGWPKRAMVTFATVWFLIAATAGHLWFSAIVSPFIAIMAFHMQKAGEHPA